MRSKLIQNKSLFERAVSSGLPTLVLSSRMVTSDFIPCELTSHWRVWNSICKRSPVPRDQLDLFYVEVKRNNIECSFEHQKLSSKQMADVIEVSYRLYYLALFTRICFTVDKPGILVKMCTYVLLYMHYSHALCLYTSKL